VLRHVSINSLSLSLSLSLSFPRNPVCVHDMSLVLTEGELTRGEAGGLHEASRACVHSFPDPSIIPCFTSICPPLPDGENTCSVSSNTFLITRLSPLRCWTRVVILLEIPCQRHKASSSLTGPMQIQNSLHFAKHSHSASVFQTC